MFRRITAVSATSAVAVRMSSVKAPGHFGYMTPKVDYHKDVETKFVSKLAFNPYASGFMENLEKRSQNASQRSDVSNGYQYHAHTGSNITSDNVF